MQIDLTLPVEPGMLSFPDYPAFESTVIRTYERDGHLSHEFTATTHSGTHIDAPAHYIDGTATVDELPLETLVGPATVLDLRSYRGEPISRAVLDEVSPSLDPGARLVLVTGDVDALPPDGSFFEAASVLTEDAADWLVEREVSLVANDFLTEGLDDPERPVHHTILGAGVPVVEYLCNTDGIADEETVELTCLPLPLVGLEASPARVVAERV
ncbi:cyclase family protein [Salinirubellus sp. GCM10025818]|uniref:cyclase family protein n=1 Tax=Salinirubellus TaxID=2162630 RepID=UPI0030CC114E